MGGVSLFEKMRQFIGTISFKLMLWSVKMTVEQYRKTIYEQEILQKRKHLFPKFSFSEPCEFINGISTCGGGIETYYHENSQSLISTGIDDLHQVTFYKESIYDYLAGIDEPEDPIFQFLLKKGIINRSICYKCGASVGGKDNHEARFPSGYNDKIKISQKHKFWWGKFLCKKCYIQG